MDEYHIYAIMDSSYETSLYEYTFDHTYDSDSYSDILSCLLRSAQKLGATLDSSVVIDPCMVADESFAIMYYAESLIIYMISIGIISEKDVHDIFNDMKNASSHA